MTGVKIITQQAQMCKLHPRLNRAGRVLTNVTRYPAYLNICYFSQDHDAVFWLGDLNYRIESTIAALEVLDHALSREYLFLAENDQLNSAREAGDAFGGFQEGERESSEHTTRFPLQQRVFYVRFESISLQE